MTDGAHRLLMVKREWPHGVAFLGDLNSSEDFLGEDDDVGVLPGKGLIGAAVLNESCSR